MNSPLATAPELGTLSMELNSAIAEGGVLSGELTVISRQPNVYTSTFPSEIITCRLGRNNEIKIFCKYSADIDNASHGARGGVAYEAEVYRQLLQNLDLSSPTLYGIYREQANNRTALVLEYLAEGVRITKSSNLEAVIMAARWIARFHALCGAEAFGAEFSFLKTYKPEYYNGWVRRAVQMINQSGMGTPWLETVCDNFTVVIEALFNSPTTAIHGEYYPKNILLQNDQIYPVDWESTAIGCGEIDLATLTEGWPPEMSEKLELEYQLERWPEGVPHDFKRCLCAARIYVQCRWLGERSDWTPYMEFRLKKLQKMAEEMGII